MIPEDTGEWMDEDDFDARSIASMAESFKAVDMFPSVPFANIPSAWDQLQPHPDAGGMIEYCWENPVAWDTLAERRRSGVVHGAVGSEVNGWAGCGMSQAPVLRNTSGSTSGFTVTYVHEADTWWAYADLKFSAADETLAALKHRVHQAMAEVFGDEQFEYVEHIIE